MDSTRPTTDRLTHRLSLTTWACRALIVAEIGVFCWLFLLHQTEQVPLAQRLGYPACVSFVIGFIVLGRIRVQSGKALERHVTFTPDEARYHLVTHLTHVVAPMLLSALAGALLSID